MPYLQTGREVVVGSICRDRTFADIEVMCGDHMPAHRASPVFVSIQFRENAAGKIKLTLASATGSGGAARFDGANGVSEREFTGGIRLLLWVFGTAASVGEAPDVTLTLRIEDELVATVPLFIGPPIARVRIRDEHDGRPPTRVTEATTLKASVRPDGTAGAYRWVSVHTDALTIAGDAAGEAVRVEPHGAVGAERALAVLFTPTVGPATMALHTFGAAGVEVRSAYWTKDLRPVGTGPTQTGELLEALVTIERSRTCVDAATVARIFIIEDDNFFFGGCDDRIVALLGTGAADPTEPYRIEHRTTSFRAMGADETLEAAVADFKAFHPGDFWEHLLLLEQTDEEDVRSCHAVAWWPAIPVSDVSGNPEYYFVLDLAGQRIESPDSESVEVSSTAVAPPEIPDRVRLRVTGTALDAHPFNPATPEPIRDAEVRGGGATVRTAADGSFTLEGFFALRSGPASPQIVEVRRPGMTTLRLNFAVALAGGQVSVTVTNAEGDAPVAALTAARPASERIPVGVALQQLQLLVHKLRGEVMWPDSRTLDDANYRGTALAAKHVYALPLADGEITPQRPPDSRTWAMWKDRPGALKSGRPGRAWEHERTEQNGQFEIGFIDLSVGKRYFVWVESTAPGTDADSPEYTVRTHYALLRELTGSQANLAVDVGKHLIDHVYNLTRDAVKWGVEAIKVVDWPLATGGTEQRVVRPQRDTKSAFETGGAAGERVTFDPTTRIAEGLRLQSLPLVPLHETRDLQSDHARTARTPIEEALDTDFPRGHVGDARWALDTGRIREAIDLPVGAWDGAWNAGDVAGSRARRICELLEKTFVLSPGIPSAHIARVEDVRWRFDAITLADSALISIPAGAAATAVVANRTLAAEWVPVLAPFSPRLLALAAGRHMLLAPGHGFYDANPPSVALGRLAIAARLVQPAHRRRRERGLHVRRGRSHRAAAGHDGHERARDPRLHRPGRRASGEQRLQPVAEPRLPAALAAEPDLLARRRRQPGGDRHRAREPRRQPQRQGHHGAPEPRRAARRRGEPDRPDARGAHECRRRARGELALPRRRDLHRQPDRVQHHGAELCDPAARWAGGARAPPVTRRALTARAERAATPANRSGNGDLQGTFDHWEQNIGGSTSVWPRVRQAPAPAAGWNHRTFPRTIPVSLVEVAFHDHADDSALLVRAWFRRRAGEAMALTVDEQLRDNAAAITRADLVRMLTECFGPTARVTALVADGTPIAGNVGAYVAAATGEPPAAVGDDPRQRGACCGGRARRIHTPGVRDRAARCPRHDRRIRHRCSGGRRRYRPLRRRRDPRRRQRHGEPAARSASPTTGGGGRVARHGARLDAGEPRHREHARCRVPGGAADRAARGRPRRGAIPPARGGLRHAHARRDADCRGALPHREGDADPSGRRGGRSRARRHAGGNHRGDVRRAVAGRARGRALRAHRGRGLQCRCPGGDARAREARECAVRVPGRRRRAAGDPRAGAHPPPHARRARPRCARPAHLHGVVRPVMAYLDRVGREVVRGSISRDHWLANVTLMAPDRLPVDEPTRLFVEVEWRRRPDEGSGPRDARRRATDHAHLRAAQRRDRGAHPLGRRRRARRAWLRRSLPRARRVLRHAREHRGSGGRAARAPHRGRGARQRGALGRPGHVDRGDPRRERHGTGAPATRR